MKTGGWTDVEAQRQVVEAINKWRELGMAHDMMDTNNLIEAFYRKLKYTFMRECSGHQLDGEVYLLANIVLRDMNLSVLLNELRIGQMSPRQRQQLKNDVEYSVRKRNSSENNMDIMSYISQFRTCDDNKENEYTNIETYDKDVEIMKLQEDLSAIIVE
ncbi:hypothetical protein C2G38_2159109 [Gigaspora rosea]|uniref:Uncharacterized protein n=1 Tax=Gigaspora rosea TaxID=44941 RepID=A0A397VZT3_9GLOM|nr:hypothetical protein C2G38_2159109 [Gigaspora rosea]